MLRRLSHLDLDQVNIVKFHEGFRLPRGRPCLVFELLDISLWDYIKSRKHLELRDIRPVIQQVLGCVFETTVNPLIVTSIQLKTSLY